MKKIDTEELENHINSRIDDFRTEVLKLANQYNHPFIGGILKKSIIKFKKEAISKEIDFVVCEESKFLF